jgi:hypothetical protein
MPAKTPSKGKKAAAPKAPKKPAAAGKAAKKPALAEDEAPIGDEPDEDEDDDFDDDLDGEDEEAPRAAAKPAAPVAKKPAAPAAKRGQPAGEDAPAVVPARRLTPEAKARVNEMVKKGMSLGDALKAAAAWETFVAPVKDEPAKLVQGRMGSGNSTEPRSNFGGETEPEDLPETDEEPVAADED